MNTQTEQDLPYLQNDTYQSAIQLDPFFTPEECLAIVAMGQSKGLQPGAVTYKEGDATPPATRNRDSQVSWLNPIAESAFVFDKLAQAVTKANRHFYRFSIDGFVKGLQYSEYGRSGHYDWHMDFGPGEFSIRKLSICVLLNDPTEFEGGTFQTFAGGTGAKEASIPQGGAIVFPSFIMHRVTPVTDGVRRSLVGWACGSSFK